MSWDYSFHSTLSSNFCPKSTDDKGKGLPVDSKIYSICPSLYKHHTVFITVALFYALKSEYVKPPNLIFVFIRCLTALCSSLYWITSSYNDALVRWSLGSDSKDEKMAKSCRIKLSQWQAHLLEVSVFLASWPLLSNVPHYPLLSSNIRLLLFGSSFSLTSKLNTN
jgi:DMSO reductase anchor subunit